MKSHLFRTFSPLAGLVLLFSLSLSGIAQESTNRQQQQQQQQPQQEEPKLRELATQELDPDVLRIAVPRECRGIRPDVQTHDVADNFNSPGSAVTLSPGLTNFLSAHNLVPKGYDDPRVNTVFADSFKLRNCRVCYATLEVRVKHYGDIWTNDNMTVGAAPFSLVRLIGAGLWTPAVPNPKPMTFALPTAALNNYLSTGSMPTFLDVVAQDDTDFDYSTLSVWYY